MIVLCTPSRAPSKSNTSRSGFCIRAAWTSRRPAPSTRMAARCGSCVMATLEITAEVFAPAASCPRTPAGFAPSTAPASIRQPHRKAGQVVFIAVLLHWSKFSYSLAAPRAFRMHPCPIHGTTRRPSQSFPLVRRTTGRLRAGNTSALADSSPPRSSRSAPERSHPAATRRPATPPCPEEDFLPHPPALYPVQPGTRTGLCAPLSRLRFRRECPPVLPPSELLPLQAWRLV